MPHFDFRKLVSKYAKPITIEEETCGCYDHTDGGKWKAKTTTRSAMAAVFNLSSRDVRGYAIQYGDGGSFTREDVKIYIHEDIIIGAKITYKNNEFTVSSAIDHSDHAHGLRIYIARKTGKKQFAVNSKENIKPEGEVHA